LTSGLVVADAVGCENFSGGWTEDDDDKGRINFSVALSPKTTRTRNNKPKQ